MKIFFQWTYWAYSHKASKHYANLLNINHENIFWLFSFKDVFNEIKNWNIWVLPVENSYAGTVHENLYLMANYDIIILSDYYQDVNHNLLSVWNDLSKIKKAFSHIQALMQCENYLKKHWIEPIEFSDTALAAKHIKELNDETIWSISSDLAWEIFGLNSIVSWIQDQTWNNTRFFLIMSKESFLKNIINLWNIKKSYKISILFKTKNIPSALYKVLWAFATRFINMTKIESLPSKLAFYEYMFWIDIQKNVEQKYIDEAIEEVKFFSKDIKILWDY